MAWVRFALRDGGSVRLEAGDLIGRSPRCAWRLDDGRISEAHAMVSLRGERLMLLALRGRFAVDGRTVVELVLSEGVEVAFAPDIVATVQEVSLPGAVLAVSVAGSPKVLLQGTTSVVAEGRLKPGWQEDALGWLWSGMDGVRWRPRGGATRRLGVGDRFAVGEVEGEVIEVSLAEASAKGTTLEGSLQAPLRIVARFQTVHLFVQGRETVLLEGVPGRVMSELVACAGPVSWQVVAGQVWREETTPEVLRQRWDAALQRLRGRLRSGGVRPDLVRSDRTGHVELVLMGHDVVEDRT